MTEIADKLRVLMIGCGNIAGNFDVDTRLGTAPRTHAGAYRAHGGFSIDACVEPDTKKRAAFMHRWGVAHGYADIADVVDVRNNGAFDVISICSPTTSHYIDAITALALGPRLLFCEKPICTNLVQAADVVRRCASQEILLAVNHNRRWDPELVRLRRELGSGEWGALRSVSCHYNKGVLNNGSHMIDLLQDLLGPLELCYVGAPVDDHTPDDPTVPAVLQTDDGVLISLNAGHAADYTLFEIQLTTERGVISMEDGGIRWRRRIAAPSQQFVGYRALPDGEFRVGEYLQTMSNAVANIYAALRTGSALASSGLTALATQKICECMRTASLKSGRSNTPQNIGKSLNQA